MNIDKNFFDSMVNRIYPSELQLNKANVSDTGASFLDLHLSILYGFVKTKIYDKRDDFDFDIVNFPFLDGDLPRSTSYGVYISHPIRFARVPSHVDDFNTRKLKREARFDFKQKQKLHCMNYQIPNRVNFGVKYEKLRVKRIIDLLYPRMIFSTILKTCMLLSNNFKAILSRLS